MINVVTTVGLDTILLHHFVTHYKSLGVDNIYVVVWGDSKKVKYKASVNLLKRARKLTKTPIVAIGGIDSDNYKRLLLNKVNFLAISGYIWKNEKFKPEEAIKQIR